MDVMEYDTEVFRSSPNTTRSRGRVGGKESKREQKEISSGCWDASAFSETQLNSFKEVKRDRS